MTRLCVPDSGVREIGLPDGATYAAPRGTFEVHDSLHERQLRQGGCFTAFLPRRSGAKRCVACGHPVTARINGHCLPCWRASREETAHA